MALSFQEVAEILKAIDESSADEIDIEIEGLRLSVRKRSTSSSTSPPAQLDSASKFDATDKPVVQPAESGAAQPEQVQTPAGHEMLRAPMVGTFYRRPSPDEPPFVEVGSAVAQGDPVCLIEVMKLYTTVESTASGEIASIFADDGDLVEFDQPLFLIKV